jgi:streptomycin 6-kinase
MAAQLTVACRQWGATVERVVDADFSAVAYVRLADGAAAVAKVPPPNDDSAHESDGLAAWNGDGAVRLLDRSASGVLLLERAEPGVSTDEDEIVAATLARLWIEPPAAVPWRNADQLSARWAGTIKRWRDRLGHRIADAAVAMFEAGFPLGPRRLLHGDGHHANILDGGPRGWLAIDPQPLVGPPALDLVPALYNGPGGAPDDRVRTLAAAAGVDADDIAQVAVPRCVVSAAWALDDRGRLDAVGERALDVARALV